MITLNVIVALLLLGAIVGIMAGLLGIGGGGIMVPALTTLFLYQGVAVDEVVHLALGTSMAAIIITSLSSLRAHHAKGSVRWDIVKTITPGIILGTFAATFLASHLSSKPLAIFFSVFMAYISVQMFLNIKPKEHRELPGTAGVLSAGGVIGGVSALVSIGGGSLTVPYLTWCNIPLKNAIGTSAAIGLPISIAGTIGYLINGWSNTSAEHLTIGFIYIPAVLIISIMSFFTAPIGVSLTHRLPVGTLKKIFSVLLIALSIKMVASVL
ncbi:sulfite exporter TauE/SafE family protein [Gynuella sp.]|uniref:sulfite exporter TauE/SafE family protein n=1 Tax=Gynuella sp. TaxID=2969146 RepID=UPI003D0CF66A